MTREMHHDVTVTQAPTPDDEGNGMQAIIKAFIKNPVAAGEIFMMLAGGFALYYGMNQGISDAKATSEQHYKDLSAEMEHNNEKILAKMEVLAASDTSEIADIKTIFSRGDSRFAELTTKLNAFDVRFARLEDGLAYVTKVIEQRTPTGIERHTEIGPRPPYATAQ